MLDDFEGGGGDTLEGSVSIDGDTFPSISPGARRTSVGSPTNSGRGHSFMKHSTLSRAKVEDLPGSLSHYEVRMCTS